MTINGNKWEAMTDTPIANTTVREASVHVWLRDSKPNAPLATCVCVSVVGIKGNPSVN